MDSTQRTVLVTGGARRIGRAIVELLHAQGWNVVVHFNHSSDDATELLAGLGDRAIALQADLNQPTAIAAMFEQARAQFGDVTAVVNNASKFEFDRGSNSSMPLWQEHMDVNLRAPIQLAQLLHAQSPASGRCVVNLLDQKVFNLNPDFFSYTLSKIALEGATRMLALEMAPQTRVCAIAPGITLPSGEQSTANFTQAHQVTPLGYSSDPQDIAAGVSYLLNAKAVTGTTLIVDGGQHLFPLKRDIMFDIQESS